RLIVTSLPRLALFITSSTSRGEGMVMVPFPKFFCSRKGMRSTLGRPPVKSSFSFQVFFVFDINRPDKKLNSKVLVPERVTVPDLSGQLFVAAETRFRSLQTF